MNFHDIYKKIASLDTPVKEGMEECGMDMMPPSPPKQQDNVTMNVSMNGSGTGGIRDLMAILKNIEDGADEKEVDILLTPDAGHDHGHEEPVFGDMEEEYANSPDPATAGIDAVTATGNDMHSKGAEAEKVNGGGNPFNVDEGLLSHLANLYQEVKSR